MKKSAVLTALAAILMMSCDTTRLGTSTDEVYANPAEERKREQAVAEQRAREEAMARQESERRNSSSSTNNTMIGKEEESSTYYKDPVYRSEDYYDYEYSSRINRFYNPIGVGYYDSYYTNMYTYNQNPMMYGTSIYSSYGYGMPSAQFSSISFGISSGWGYGGGGMMNTCYPFYSPYYDPWCSTMYGGWSYGYGYGNPYNSWGYMNGYNNGFYNGYYQGMNTARWGYYNSYDGNSNYSKVEYGPRGSNGGGNSRNREVVTNGDGQQRYLESVAEQQRNSPRFTDSRNNGRVMRNQSNENNNTPARPNIGTNTGSSPAPEQRGRDNGRDRNSGRIMERRQEAAPQNQGRRSSEQPVLTNPGNPPANPGGGRNSGGGSSPRNSGGGSNRPR